ncbi:MAG: hypothetical protein ACTHYC_00480 [Sphingobacterium sp.]
MEDRVIMTGDIIHSRLFDSDQWMSQLEQGLAKYAQSYDIFRGDSFQAEIAIEDLFAAVFYLKATMRQFDGMDVRIGIGVGDIKFRAQDIKKSSGEAFVRSGKALDSLQKESLAFQSSWPELDERINLTLSLASRLTDQWTANMAQTVKAAIDHPKVNQTQLSKIVGRTHQSQVSTELRKANLTKILEVVDYCTNELKRYAN